MLPGVAILVPLVAIFKGLGLIDTLPGMAIGHIALTVPLVTWILIGTFDGVEPDLEHAARIDGASRLQALRRVVLPLTVPSIVTAAVFAFVLSWNDLLVSKVLYVGSTPMLAPAIVNLMDPLNRIEPQLSMAGVIASVPVLMLALLMQRYLIRGLGEGAVKYRAVGNVGGGRHGERTAISRGGAPDERAAAHASEVPGRRHARGCGCRACGVQPGCQHGAERGGHACAVDGDGHRAPPRRPARRLRSTVRSR